MVGTPDAEYRGPMTSSEPAAGPDPGIAEFVAQRTAEFSEAARAVHDEAATAGTLVWDPYDPAWVEDPYAVYAELRARNPVHRDTLGFWVFTRHADCLAILRDRRSSSDGRNVDESTFREVRAVDLPLQEGTGAVLAEMAPFLFRDPPDHTRLPRAGAEGVHAQGRGGLRPRLQEICDGLLDEAFDAATSTWWPTTRTRSRADHRGDAGRARRGPRAVPGLVRTRWPGASTPTSFSPKRCNCGWVRSCRSCSTSTALIEERRQKPGDDLLTRLIQAEEQGDVLTQGELLSTCILLLVAGHETTVNLISGGALALMERPRRARPRAATIPASLLPVAVEEMLRFVCPVQLTGRVALEDMEVGGALIAAGELSMLLIGSANHDPGVFDDPDTFDVTRGRQQPSGLRLRHPPLPGRPAGEARRRSSRCPRCSAGPVASNARPTPSPTKRTSCSGGSRLCPSTCPRERGLARGRQAPRGPPGARAAHARRRARGRGGAPPGNGAR